MGSTLLTVGIVIVIAAIVLFIVRRKRKGGCASCPHCGSCDRE